ncbi:MAG: hypothetical protein JWR90_791 [Marmoricola sp.]|nr:hypothetical protein [Marmoricola sp.]
MTHPVGPATRTAPEAETGSEPGKGDAVTRVLGWMPYLLLAGLLFGMVRAVTAPISNPDTFFHLRYGHEFLTHWSLRHPGHVSTFGHRDWVPTQWASQMLMALTENAFGLAGVAWLSGLVVLTTVVTVFLVARRYADPLPAAVVSLLAVLGMSANLTPRPQVVSYLLVLVVTHVWLRTAQDLRPRWWLVPLTWVWATVHGMWPIGALIGLVAVLGIAIDQRSRLADLRPVLLRLLAVPVLSLVAAAATPVGPRLYGAVLLVGGRAKFHSEWAPTDFHDRQAAIAALLVVVTLVIWLMVRRDERPDWVSLLLLLMAAGWSAYAVRTVPLAAMMTVPFVAAALQSLVGRSRPAPRRERAVVAAVVVAAVAAMTALVPVTADRPATVPGWLNPALDRLPDGTSVQATDVMGGYLMWRHPELNPVIDGYSDAYTTAWLQKQLDLQELKRGWDRTLRESKVRYALLPPKSALAYELGHLEGWRVLHESKDVTMFEAPEGWGR